MKISHMFYLAVASLLLMSDVTDATSLIDSPRESSKKAWVTVLTDSNFNNTQLAATQILSVKRFSEHEHITLVLSLVDEETREFLEGLGSSIVEVSRIQPPFEIAGKWFQDIFSRLHLWNLLDFEQVTYLDADALLINDDADGIFNECDADFCAVGRDRLSFDELISDESRNMGDTQLFNAGVMVLRPDKDVFDYLVNEALPEKKISDAEYSADEHFLAEIFFQLKHNLRTFQHRSHVGSSKLLGFKYNTCSPEFDDMCGGRNSYIEGHVFGPIQFECWKKTVDEVSIFHHCGYQKLLHVPLCVWKEEEEPEYCKMQHMKIFQEFLIQANPCALGNQGVEECSKQDQCKWNGSMRCVPAHQDDPLNSIEQSEMRLLDVFYEGCGSGGCPTMPPKSSKSAKKAKKSKGIGMEL